MSKALKLAHWLENELDPEGTVRYVAAAELRRLHALVEEDSILLRRQRDEIASLKALNAELVEALKDLLFWGADDVYQRSKIACERARAAIDAARSKE